MIFTDGKEAKRAYEREWRKNNPEKVRAIKKRYWDKKAEQAEKEQGKKSHSDGSDG